MNVAEHKAKVNMSEAARLVGVSRTTFYKDIKRKNISIEIDDEGNKQVQVAELLRVYNGKLSGTLTTSDPNAAEQVNLSSEHGNGHGLTHAEQGEIPEIVAVLRERISHLEVRIESLERDKAENRKEKENLMRIIEQQTALLPPPQQPTKKTGFWSRLFGRG